MATPEETAEIIALVNAGGYTVGRVFNNPSVEPDSLVREASWNGRELVFKTSSLPFSVPPGSVNLYADGSIDGHQNGWSSFYLNRPAETSSFLQSVNEANARLGRPPYLTRTQQKQQKLGLIQADLDQLLGGRHIVGLIPLPNHELDLVLSDGTKLRGRIVTVEIERDIDEHYIDIAGIRI